MKSRRKDKADDTKNEENTGAEDMPYLDNDNTGENPVILNVTLFCN